LTHDIIREASETKKIPEVEGGSCEDGDARFCVVDSETRQALLCRFSRDRFVRIPSPAEKDLSNELVYPTLGVNITLPQFWPSTWEEAFRPAQDEYWCGNFFYGSLARSRSLNSPSISDRGAGTVPHHHHWRSARDLGREISRLG
jgi:hypothetical protein